MKKLLLIFTTLFLFTLTTTAQKSAISIGIDAFGFANELEQAGAYTGFTIGVESALSKRFTGSVRGSMRSNNIGGTNIFNIGRKFKNVDAGINFYPKRANRGIYLGVSVAHARLDFPLEGEDPPTFGGTSRYFGGGANLGFKAKLSRHLSFGMDTGMKVLSNSNIGDELVQFSIGGKFAFTF